MDIFEKRIQTFEERKEKNPNTKKSNRIESQKA